MNAQRKRWALNVNDGRAEAQYLTVLAAMKIAQRRGRTQLLLDSTIVYEDVRQQLLRDGCSTIVSRPNKTVTVLFNNK